MPAVTVLDHLVLTVSDLDVSIRFYTDGMGMAAEPFHPADGSTRWALWFGSQKINLHPSDGVFAPHAAAPGPGTADLCFLSNDDLTVWAAHFAQASVPIVDGPVARTGATGPIVSLYVRDPDGNLIEISNRA